MRVHLSIAAASIALLAGCTTAPVRPVMPQTVQVVVTKYIPVPAQLTAPCPVAELTTGTGFDALAVGHQRKLSLQDCDDRMTKIRGLHD